MSPRVLVFTYKDGLLARLAHDLQLCCRSFSVVRTGETLTARFALTTLKVDGAVERGRVAPGVLSDGDRRKIEQTIADDVLELRRFAEATFSGKVAIRGTDPVVDGTLTLHGRTVPIGPVTARKRDGRWVAEISLVPSRWGIAPYRALAGALKLQDRITVRVELPAEHGDGDAHWDA